MQNIRRTSTALTLASIVLLTAACGSSGTKNSDSSLSSDSGGSATTTASSGPSTTTGKKTTTTKPGKGKIDPKAIAKATAYCKLYKASKPKLLFRNLVSAKAASTALAKLAVAAPPALAPSVKSYADAAKKLAASADEAAFQTAKKTWVTADVKKAQVTVGYFAAKACKIK